MTVDIRPGGFAPANPPTPSRLRAPSARSRRSRSATEADAVRGPHDPRAAPAANSLTLVRFVCGTNAWHSSLIGRPVGTDSPAMTRVLRSAGLASLLLLTTAPPALADVTGFLGWTTSPASRGARGFSIGINLLVVGFELEYSKTAEDITNAAPSLQTTMFNGLLSTPTGDTQLYLTAGGGVFRERFGELGETHFGTNFGGGVKIGLIGPLRLRLDYRVFALRGEARFKNPQRFYVGINIPF